MLTGLLATSLLLAPGEIAVHVEGEGYLRFLREGRAVYARQAALVVEKGELREKSGPGFLPPIRVPAGHTVSIGEDGTVTLGPGHAAAGRLYLARFAPATAFEPSGAFVIARDRADLGYPAQAGYGKISTKTDAAPPKVELRRTQMGTPKPVETQPAPSPSRTVGNLTIAILAAVEVEGPKFSLGDIAKISGPAEDVARLNALDLGNAPVHGVPMLYTRERILAKATLLGFDRKALSLEMPPMVEITRKGQTVTVDKLVEVARRAVEEKLGMKGEMSPDDRIVDFRVPLGKLEIASEGVNLAGGVATVSLGIRIDGRRFTGRTLRLSGPALEVAVAMGSAVTVRFVSNGLMVEMPGKARTAGAIGQTIDVTVTIPETRETTTHQATIVRAGVVEVKL